MHRSLDLPVLSIAIRLSFVTKVTKEYVCGGSFIGWGEKILPSQEANTWNYSYYQSSFFSPYILHTVLLTAKWVKCSTDNWI